MKIHIPIISFGRSGGFRVLSQLANFWIKAEHEVIFICFSENGLISKPYYPTNATIKYVNNQGNEIKEQKGFEIFNFDQRSPFLRRFKQLNSLRRAINKFTNQNDIILATYSLIAFSVRFSKPSKNKYYYIQAYEPEYFDKSVKGIIASQLVSFTYLLNLKRIVNSPIYFNYKILKANKCVYPGLDFNIFNSENKVYKYEFNSKPMKIGCIGRSEKSKGTKFVLEAYTSLINNDINCQLIMAEFGNKEMLLNYNDIVIITPQNDKELSDFYKNIDVLIAPGLLQMGAVHYPVIEAMACGTSVITTGYHPANTENAWLVSPKSSFEIAEQVKNIMNNPEIAKLKATKAKDDINNLDWAYLSNQMILIFQNK